MDPRREFRSVQSDLADACDVDITSRELSVDIDLPLSTAHCLDAGSGEPVLFLPGSTHPGASYLPLIAELTDDYRCLAVDRPGDGLAEMVDYSKIDYREMNDKLYPAILNELGIDSAHVVAHSQGGFQAFHLAFDHPERIRRLCLLGAPGGLSNSGPLVFRLLAVPYLNRLLVSLSTHDDPDAVRSYWERTIVEDASEIPTELLAVQVANENLPGWKRAQRTLAESLWSPLSGTRSRFVFPEQVREIEHPTLFVWGTEDFFQPPEIGQAVAADMPNARFEVLKEHGHTVWLEAGNDVATLVREFLGEADGEADSISPPN
jgi:pimeloyl-ACP methyl ester carboxylesterase